MRRVITKEHAVKIKDKLKARAINSRNKAHDEYVVEEDGIQIAIISIRRGSEWDKGHDYITKDIHVGPHQAKELANCPMKRPAYIALMREKGILPQPPAPPVPPAPPAEPDAPKK